MLLYGVKVLFSGEQNGVRQRKPGASLDTLHLNLDSTNF
jgi:hypothetical protein